jgi:hypothetical protein
MLQVAADTSIGIVFIAIVKQLIKAPIFTANLLKLQCFKEKPPN